jgi:trigger factor
MSNISIEKGEKNTVKIVVKFLHEEAKPYLEEAAQKLSEETKIDGFRPGKASYDVVKQRVGEMKIYELALDIIVRKTFLEAVTDNNLEPVGSPKVDVVKLAPENDIEFTLEISQMPKVEELADYKAIKVKKNKIKVDDKEVDLTLNNLTRMQTKEVRAKSEEACTEDDKIVVSMEMKKDGVVIEGGSSPNHAIFLREDYFIPGFKEEVIGLKEGDKKTFTLTFPEEHAQKMLAGAPVEFSVEVKEVYHLESPELNDEFAKTLGQESMEQMREVIKKNIEQEKDHDESARQEREMLETIAKKSRFQDIPDLLVNHEINKMIEELKQGVAQQGLEFDQYLESIKKTYADLKMDFTPQALMRIKIALAMRAVADKEGVKVDEKEIDAEIDKIAAQRPEEHDYRKQLFSPEYREYTEGLLKNRKVIELLRKEIIE